MPDWIVEECSYSWAAPMLCPTPTSGCGISSRFWSIRAARSLVLSHQLAAAVRRVSTLFHGTPLSRLQGWMHTVIAHYLLIQHARLALIPHVGDPDGPDAEPALGGAHVKFIPQRLIQFLPTVRT